MQRTWRIVLGSAAVVVAVALTGLGMAYSLGAFAAQGRFSAVPGCDVIDPATVGALLPGATVHPQPQDACVAERDGFSINFKFSVVRKSGRTGGPDAAELMLTAGAGGLGETEELKGVGDQAVRYRSKAIGAPQVVTMRVSNLIVVLTTLNLSNGKVAEPADDALVKVASALGARLSANE